MRDLLCIIFGLFLRPVLEDRESFLCCREKKKEVRFRNRNHAKCELPDSHPRICSNSVSWLPLLLVSSALTAAGRIHCSNCPRDRLVDIGCCHWPHRAQTVASTDRQTDGVSGNLSQATWLIQRQMTKFRLRPVAKKSLADCHLWSAFWSRRR